MVFFITNLFVFAVIFWKLASTKISFNFLKLKNTASLGNKLFEQLIEINSFCGSRRNNIELSEYKFFTSIVDSLLSSAVKYGTSLHEYLPKIKKALVSDLRFEKKIKGELIGGIIQMLIVQVFCFLFIGSFFVQLHLKLNLSDLIVPVLLQIIGYLLFIISFFYIKKKTFSDLEKYIETFYLISALLFAKISLSKIHEKCKISTLSDHKELRIFKQRVSIIFQEIKRNGSIQDQEMDIALDELWFLFDYKFEYFLKLLAVLKLFIIIFFFLSSFMLVLMNVLPKLQL